MTDITRIADLPLENNITMQMPVQQQQQQQQQVPGFVSGASQNTYIPINVHQNPYGHNQPDVMANPQYQQKLDVPMSNKLTQDQQSMVMNYPKQNLPSRDIHVDSSEYMQDDQIRANYIPPSYHNKDYIQEHEEKHVEKHAQKVHRERLVDIVLNKIQTPLFVAVLYFIFQMPLLNNLLYKMNSFLPIYREDGNMNTYGLLFKSLLFGSMFYSSSQMIDYISEL